MKQKTKLDTKKNKTNKQQFVTLEIIYNIRII